MQSLFEAAGGEAGLLELARAWHARVVADDVVGHAFRGGVHPQHEQRLAAYWAECLGGPTRYSDDYGDESYVVRLHSGEGEHQEMDQQAIACFDQALTDVGLDGNTRLCEVLHDYFASVTLGRMCQYPNSRDEVPDGLGIPHWTWDGPLAKTPA